MKEIPIETGSYYIFDRANNLFEHLYRFNCAGAFFVVRAKKNLRYRAVTWKRRMPKNVLSDSVHRTHELQKRQGLPRIVQTSGVP